MIVYRIYWKLPNVSQTPEFNPADTNSVCSLTQTSVLLKFHLNSWTLSWVVINWVLAQGSVLLRGTSLKFLLYPQENKKYFISKKLHLLWGHIQKSNIKLLEVDIVKFNIWKAVLVVDERATAVCVITHGHYYYFFLSFLLWEVKSWSVEANLFTRVFIMQFTNRCQTAVQCVSMYQTFLSSCKLLSSLIICEIGREIQYKYCI